MLALLLGALSLFAAGPAQAQDVWSATLNPKSFGSNIGCDTSQSQNVNKCSNTAVLDDNTFTHSSTNYTVYSIKLVSGALGFGLDTNNPSGLSSLSLCVGSTRLAFSSATIDGSALTATWSSTGLTWTAGTPVGLSIVSGSTCTVQTQSSDATLSGLSATSATSQSGTFSALTLTPSTFDSATTAYTATVPNATTHLKLTATVNESNATVKYRKGSGGSFTDLTSGTPSAAISLDEGSNAITVRVTAQDTTTTKDYTVTITRRAQQTTTTTPGRNLLLTDLTISDGTNDLPLQPNVANAVGLGYPGIYAVHVDLGIREIFVTPTFTEATVDARTYAASGGAGGTSRLGSQTWNNTESGTEKSLPLLSYNGVTRLQIEIGSALYQIYVYHNYNWDTVNARLKRLEMLTN